MRDIELRPATKDDIDGLVRLAKRNGVHSSPDELSAECERQRSSILRADPRFFLRLVAERRGEIIGTGLARPSVFAPTGWFVVNVQVDAHHRRRGVGSATLTALEDQVVQRGGHGLEGRAADHDRRTQQWACHRGFRPFVDELTCVLDIGDAPSARALTDGVEGVRFFSLADTRETVDVARLYDLTATLLGEIPEIRGGRGPSAEDVRSFFTQRTTMRPEATWVATQGERWVGVTINAAHSDDLYTWFTGVEPGLWGRGIGRALKTLAIESARSLGIRRMITQVASTNVRMLAANQRLGYMVTDSVSVLRKCLPTEPDVDRPE